jgi:hypothetical protein
MAHEVALRDLGRGGGRSGDQDVVVGERVGVDVDEAAAPEVVFVHEVGEGQCRVAVRGELFGSFYYAWEVAE